MDRKNLRGSQGSESSRQALLAPCVFAATLITGCAGLQSEDVSGEYRESDYTWSKTQGTARITGQAFLKTMGGDVKYCAGEEIRLWPDAPYTRAIWRVGDAGKNIAKPHPDSVQPYIRRTTGDGVGGFDFPDLPAGRYYVACRLVWTVGTGVYAQQTGGYATAIVDVAEGETKKVIATAR